MNEVAEKPTKKDQQIAKRSLPFIDKIDRGITDKSNSVGIDINGKQKTHIEIPAAAFKFLKLILNNMAEGKSISVVPEETELSTQQAADMLNVSRPHIIKLLENGEIPFSKVGTHRRIKMEDLKKFSKKIKKEKDKALGKLTREAQELNMGY